MADVLVTGGAGFIGSHVADALLAAGYDAVVVDDLSTGRVENLPGGVRFHRVDVLSNEFERVFASERPRYVCHLAAQVSVSLSVKAPDRDATTNVLGSLRVLECCRTGHVERLVFASSAAVYGEPQYLPIDEAHPIAPLSPYGITKHTAEQYMHAYALIHGLGYVVLRYANVFGPRQDAKGEAGVVAIFLERMLREGQPSVEGDGEQTRDFVYVEDVAQATVAALGANLSEGRPVFNIGTAQEVTIGHLFEAAKTQTGYSGPRVHIAARKGDIRRSVLDCGQAQRRLRWRAKTSLEEGLRRTVAHLRGRMG